MLRAVPVRYADASADQREAFIRRYRVKTPAELPRLGSYRRERNGLIVSSIGDIAVEVAAARPATVGDERPVVAAAYGLGHFAPVRRLLRRSGHDPRMTRHGLVPGNSPAARFLDRSLQI